MKRTLSIAALSVATLVAASVVFADTTASLLPTADGTYTQWTPKSGAVHYTQVDESTCNGTTDYNSTATVGNRDSYVVNLASVPNDATITSIAITPCASRNASGGGSATMNVFYRFSGVNSADAGAYALTGTTPTALSATTFSSLSHVKGPSSTLEVGAVYSAGTRGARLGRIATVITYTPAAPAVTTNAASSLTTTTGTLNGAANPKGATTTGWFRYSTTNPGVCDDTFGTRLPSSGGTSLGSGTSSVAYALGATGLTPGTTYYYCAIASSTGGTGFGSVVSFTTTPLAPSAPTGLSVTNISGTQNNLAWTDTSSNETNFLVERSQNSTSNFTQIASTSANAISFNNTGLVNNQTYYYRVRAYNTGGYSAYTTTAYGITATVVPSAPWNFSATASSTNVILAWNQTSNNEEGFKVERGTDGINFGEITTLGMNAVGYTDPGLSSGTYYYRLRAYNAIGNSVYSSTTSATIP